MSNPVKCVLFSIVFMLAGCSSDTGSGGQAPAPSTSASKPAPAKSMASDAVAEKQLPAGPIETPEWARVEHTVNTN